jgi:hypothetical protein
MKEKTQTILLFVSVVIMMAWFVVTVWGDLVHKDVETIKEEQEREARRLERMEMIKNMK